MKGHWIEAGDGDSEEIPAGAKLARVTPAEPADSAFVLAAPVGDPDGRSDWVWLRLPDGTLALATFPCGDTYLEISEPGKGPFWP